MPKDVEYNLLIPRPVARNITTCCICLEKKTTINQPCGLNVHRICMTCITKIIEAIPISKEKPWILCQYPFEECTGDYDKTFIKSVLKERYPVYKLASDAYLYSEYSVKYCPGCSKLLVFEDEFDYNMAYECIYCFTTYCFVCDIKCQEGATTCIRCNLYEDINPYADNEYFYKEGDRKNIADYYYKNNEVGVEVAYRQLCVRLDEVCVKCPVCTTSLYRTEQCNSLKHCHVEICFSCGAFSGVGMSLGDHWSAIGRGCSRWSTDPVVKKLEPSYECVDGVCYSHGSGDCSMKDHSVGRNRYNEFKKRQYIYHSLKSLLPRIRYQVIGLMNEEQKKYLPGDNSWDYLDNGCNTQDNRHYMTCVVE